MKVPKMLLLKPMLYLTNAVKTFANWDENTDKLSLIWKQKYIAMCGINGLELIQIIAVLDFLQLQTFFLSVLV
ncbi:MAG: hypothetical protein QM800_02415 [Paludibacter sp.]